MSMSMRIPYKLFFILLLLAGGAYLFLHRTPSKDGDKSDKKNAPVPVLAAKAEIADMPIVLDLVGRGEAFESVSIKSRVDGQVHDVRYKEGQAVRTGDVLLHLDPSDFDARLKQAEATLAKDRALYKQAEAQVVRYQSLKDHGFVSDEKVADLRAAAAAAAATVKADQANVDLARLQLSYATIQAPIDGIVGAQLVFPGTAVKTNDTVLAVVNRIRPLHVTFYLPENHLAALREEMRLGSVTAEVTVPGDSKGHHPAIVDFVDNAVDPATGTVMVKARLDNKDGALSAGQYLRVDLTLKTLKDVVVIPGEAVQQGPSGTVVYVVKPDNGIVIRKVKVAASRAGLAAIGSGVQAGETVITDGHLKLTPKSKVKINKAVTK
jgi:multidrug efflux system membrane fusion protein